jgi:hypothetical protein
MLHLAHTLASSHRSKNFILPEAFAISRPIIVLPDDGILVEQSRKYNKKGVRQPFSNQLEHFISTISPNGLIFTIASRGDAPYTAPGFGLDQILFAYNSNGEQLWTRSLKIFINTSNDFAFGVHATSDAVYVVGYSNHSFHYPMINKFNHAGTLEWARQPDSTWNNEWFNGVTTDASGNVYAVGRTPYPDGGVHPLIVSYTSAGVFRWSRVCQAAIAEEFRSACVLSDGSIIAGGLRPAITRWASNGTLLWSRLLDSSCVGLIRKLIPSNDGNFYFQVSRRVDAPNNNDTLAIIKMDPNGNVIWTRNITAPIPPNGFLSQGQNDLSKGSDFLVVPFSFTSFDSGFNVTSTVTALWQLDEATPPPNQTKVVGGVPLTISSGNPTLTNISYSTVHTGGFDPRAFGATVINTSVAPLAAPPMPSPNINQKIELRDR